MSNQGVAYGDLRRRQEIILGKRDKSLEKEALAFLVALGGEGIDVDDIMSIKDGKALCTVINKYIQNPVKIETVKGPFQMRSNVENFSKGCQQFGIKEQELFQVNDLVEAKNLPQVVVCLSAFGRELQKIPGYDGPIFGPKESAKNPREFTEEQMQAGKHIHSLQMGSNKGASQAGQNFGLGRQIIDSTSEKMKK